ncbi:MAG: hypothetical protein HFE84_08775 [Lachnospiraceae bacterium]|nr:hypothetical protein [Lachnospiraceae bacterium]
MGQKELLLKKEEQVVFGLRRLFEQYGYRRFEMSKFEEYDFYAENRSFLDSENILTFTGLDGKLLALKPDVTLSIVKNSKGSLDAADRVYYNENVYRARKGDKEYREIMQAGLEYIGPIDTYAVLEVLLLAKRCLEMIDGPYLMDLSHMGFVAGLLEGAGLAGGKKKRLLKAIREKNGHELYELCESEGVSEEMRGRLTALASIYGPLKETLPAVKALCCSERTGAAYAELFEICRCLEVCGELSRVSLDFSVVNDMDYYNGITFQGFIEGIPNGVLSGGRYDSLVHKLGKKGGAVGFAVYVHLLERFRTQRKEYDTDVLLLYGRKADPAAVACAAKKLAENGERVMVCRENTGCVRFKRLLSIEGGEE